MAGSETFSDAGACSFACALRSPTPAEATAGDRAMEHGAGQTSLALRLGFAAATFFLLAVALAAASGLS